MVEFQLDITVDDYTLHANRSTRFDLNAASDCGAGQHFYSTRAVSLDIANYRNALSRQ